MAQPTEKPRRRRKAARPEEIRRAALAELAEKGIGGSTLGGIAKRAGISRTTVYLYFETKQEIFEAIVRDTIERNIDETAALVRTHQGSFEDVFSKAMDGIYGKMVSGDAALILRALVAEGREQTEIVAFYHREILAKGEDMLRHLVKRGVESGELSKGADDLDLRILISPAIFAAMWGLVFGQIEPLDVARFKRDHVNLMLRGLLKPRGAKR